MFFVLAAFFALIISALLYYRHKPELSPKRKMLLLGLRTVSLFVLLIILLSPVLSFTHSKQKSAKVLLLKDRSNSMEIRHQERSKAQLLEEIGTGLAERYRTAGYDIVEYDFADGIQGSNDNSLLSKTLMEISEKEDLAEFQAILLASDGWLRDDSFQSVSRLGIPVFSIADTTRSADKDIAIVELKANRYAYRNENTIIRAKLAAQNFSGSVRLNLFIGDTKVISKSLDLVSGTEQSVDFEYRFPQTGFFNYRVEAEPLEKERNTGNNLMPGAIEVLAEKELISVFSDSPGWDNKFILDAIATNPRWQSVSYQVRNGSLYKGESPAQLSATEGPAVIVIINNGNLRLDTASRQYIQNAVRRGCGLFYQGLPIAALAEILPLNESNIKSPYQGFVKPQSAATNYPMLNPLGREAGKLPPLDYYYVNPASGAELLATMNNPQNSPAIAIKHSGQSRALSFSFLNLWRWQMQSKDSGYQKMIVNILTWLSNKALGSYSAIYKSTYLQGENLLIRLRAENDIHSHDLDKSPRISIFDDSGKLISQDFMTLSKEEYIYQSRLLQPGNYSFEIQEPEQNKSSKGAFAISAMAVEERDYDFNLPLLSYISAQSGGRIVSLQEIDTHRILPPRIQNEITKREYDLYKKWYIPAIFILSFCLELFLRRRWGLL